MFRGHTCATSARIVIFQFSVTILHVICGGKRTFPPGPYVGRIHHALSRETHNYPSPLANDPLCHSYKVFSIIILHRIQGTFEPHLPKTLLYSERDNDAETMFLTMYYALNVNGHPTGTADSNHTSTTQQPRYN